MDMKRVFVTGMSGYLGSRLCDRLDSAPWCERFYGMDRRLPLAKYHKGEFRRMEIDDPALVEWIEEIKPDAVIHTAFILQPIKNVALRRRVNLGGTINLLEAAHRASARQVVVISSGTVFGAHPDNPVPLKETDALRPNTDFGYAVDKQEVEERCRTYAREHPRAAVCVLRPCVIYGRLVNNYLSELLEGDRVPVIRGHEPPLQFVHEDDVVLAVETVLLKEGRGVFNLAPPDTVTQRQSAEIAGKDVLEVGYTTAKLLVGISWRISRKLSSIPPAFIDYVAFPWVMDSTLIQRELGFGFRYSSREALEIMLRSKGIIE